MCTNCAAKPTLKVFKSLELLFDKNTSETDKLASYHVLKDHLLTRVNSTEVVSDVPLLCQGLSAEGKYVYKPRQLTEQATG
jgi:hypothetical protein